MQSHIYFISWAYFLQLGKVELLASDWDPRLPTFGDLVTQMTDGGQVESPPNSIEQDPFTEAIPSHSKRMSPWSGKLSFGPPDWDAMYFLLGEHELYPTDYCALPVPQPLKTLPESDARKEIDLWCW